MAVKASRATVKHAPVPTWGGGGGRRGGGATTEQTNYGRGSVTVADIPMTVKNAPSVTVNVHPCLPLRQTGGAVQEFV